MRKSKRGQSLVELALILPIVMAMMMAVVDFSFVLYGNVQLAGACGEAARAGASAPGDLTLTLEQNDASRLTAIKNAVYNTSTSQTTLGRLKTTPPNFEIDDDVEVSYPYAPTTVTRSGDQMVVTLTYRQPIWFNIIPGSSAGAVQISTSTRIRIQ